MLVYILGIVPNIDAKICYKGSLMATLERVPEDSPLRCQAVHAHMQCPFKIIGEYDPVTHAYTGPRYCSRHAGHGQNERMQREGVRLYLLTKYQGVVDQMNDSPKAKSIREEVGILRMILQTQLNKCQDDLDLLMRASSITELVNAITRTIKACTEIEQVIGFTIDKDQAFLLMQDILSIINEFIIDPEILQKISDRMVESLESATTKKALPGY